MCIKDVNGNGQSEEAVAAALAMSRGGGGRFHRREVIDSMELVIMCSDGDSDGDKRLKGPARGGAECLMKIRSP